MPDTPAPSNGPRGGLIGLGWMGSNFAQRLIDAGVAPVVFDRDAAKAEALAARGAEAARSAADLVARCDLVLLSLPTSDVFVAVAEGDVLPHARPGQVVVDLGTSRIGDTRRVAGLLEERGAALLDAPVSGDPRRPVRMFVGGPAEAFETARPSLEVLSHPPMLTHGGPSGAGQILKGVNQLAMGLVSAAWLETVAFATRQGIAPEVVARAVGGDGGWRGELANQARTVAAGQAEAQDAKFAELPYFLDAAKDAGLPMPLTEALFTFCDAGPRDWRDNMNRPYTSFWHMLHHPPESAPADSSGPDTPTGSCS